MSWFEYDTLPPKKRKLRKGVWLRVRCLPQPILDAIKPKFRSKRKRLTGSLSARYDQTRRFSLNSGAITRSRTTSRTERDATLSFTFS